MSAADLAKVLAALQAVIDLKPGDEVPVAVWCKALSARTSVLIALDGVKVEVAA